MTSSFLESPSGRLGGLAYTPEARAEMTMLPLTLLAIAERADSKLIGVPLGASSVIFVLLRAEDRRRVRYLYIYTFL